ncbi:MAG: hypothetical protein JW840_07655 [Candidatus Thermoplasmatota archaeon]|nr:hypothetical protein [Candidatus Thermoplasmatota archaeon]
MSKIKNSDLTNRVFNALFTVVSRRTLDSFAVQILRTTMDKLETKFDFLEFIRIHDDFFTEDGITTTFDPAFDTIEPSQLGPALDALIRVIYLELTATIGDEVGLYFISELKQHLGDSSVDELRTRGVNLEKIQAEQHMRYHTKESYSLPPTPQKRKEQETPVYTWDMVETWRYDNNVCILYDDQGKLLDTIHLDLLVEEYVERVTESRKQHPVSSPRTTMLTVNEKETELLEMIRRRDLDVPSAMNLLHVSQQKFDTMIQKLLQLEMLQHISENEVKLTEKGLQHLSKK